ncbi:MAG: hypothetical protein ABJL71_18945 [Cyclobacteriaceae bacterium]
MKTTAKILLALLATYGLLSLVALASPYIILEAIFRMGQEWYHHYQSLRIEVAARIQAMEGGYCE